MKKKSSKNSVKITAKSPSKKGITKKSKSRSIKSNKFSLQNKRVKTQAPALTFKNKKQEVETSLKLSNKIKAEILKTYHAIWDAVLKGDMKTFASYLDSHVTIYGSAEGEIFNSKKAAAKFYETTADEMTGKVDLRKRSIGIKMIGSAAIINEECDLYVLTGKDWTYYGHARISEVLEQDGKTWKISHHHTSFPDHRTEEGQQIAAEKIAKENLELREAVKRRTVELEQKNRELAIEAAMEKVRARSLAMQKPEELVEVAEVLRKEMGALGIEELETSSIYIVDEIKGTTECWYAIKDVRGKNKKLVTDHIKLRLNETWVGREMQKFYHTRAPRTSILMRGKNRKEWINYCAEKSSVLQGYYGDEIPERTYHLIKFSNGFMGAASPGEISAESWGLLQRATSVFSFAYKRFSDLKQAEAQAREAQIEAALERVRSRSMAMHKSNELKEVIKVVLEQFVQLNINVGHAGFYIDYKAHDAMHIWLADPNIEPFFAVIPYFNTPTWNSFIEAKARGTLLHTDLLDFKTKNKFYKSLFKLFTVPEEAQQFYMQCKGLAVSTVLLENIGLYIENFSAIPYTDEENEILIRFGKVFQQTYTRFLDLQKAEAQAREAEIQLALERVRARTMAMQKSEELAETATILFQQVRALGIESYTSGFTIWENNDTELVSWTSNADGSINPPFRMPAQENKWHLRQLQSWRDKEEYVIGDFSDSDMQEYYAYLRSFPLLNEAFKKSEASGVETPARQVHNVFNFAHGNLLFITLKPVPESYDIFKRFAKTFEQAYTRFIDLQKAEAQARESQIQLALERVRARTMAMQKSDELAEVSFLLNKQVVELGILTRGCAFNIYGENDSTEWFSNLEGTLPAYKTPRENIFLKYYEAGQHGEALLIEEFDKKRIKQHYDYLHSLHLLGTDDEVVEKIRNAMPDSQIDHVAYFKYGYLLFITLAPAPDAHDIFKRFAKEFEQTYTRFLDLQKAEAQSRESQIQLALERVRARTMAMQHSSELAETSYLLVKQVLSLGIKSWGCAFNIFDEDQPSSTEWFSNDQGYKSTYKIPREGVFLRYYQAAQRGESLHVEEFIGDACAEHYRYLSTLPGLEEEMKMYARDRVPLPTSQYDNVVFFKYGYLLFVTYENVPEAHDIFKRFTKVFEQTYTRFLDLQKAEAQAREAQIEASLERVRSKTMAMHSSREVGESVATLFDELSAMKLLSSTDRCGIGIMQPDEIMELWTAEKTEGGKTELTIGFLDMKPHPLLRSAYSGWVEKKEVNQYILAGEDKLLYYQAMQNQTQYKIKKDYYSGSEKIVHTDFYFNEGVLYVFSQNEFDEESVAVFIRFANVFGQTYRRYLDLKKAEAQAREAQIETALEKVRSRTMAMQSSEELADAAYILFEQLNILGVTHERINIGIVNEQNQTIDFWVTEQGGEKLNTNFSGRVSEPTTLSKTYQAWKKGEKSLMVDLKGEDLKSWLKYINEEIKIPFNNAFLHDRRVQTAGFFSKGMLVVTSPEPLQEEALYLLEKFAGVFDLTYTRFNDLKIAEAHALQAKQDLIAIKEAKQKAEIALSELQNTQKQLIQAEKMASLGELTAGIAHEIQNPLNFVNNFSEVSNELIEEIEEERAKHPESRDENLVSEILSDIRQNLQKINHHGKRADAIVKGMLQHSRSSSGQKELTDINALCDEYLRLSYHGLRAKDKSFNAKFETHLEPTLPKVNVVPQDIGRVILNLINNAFYAVSEKQKAESAKTGSGYEPTVAVSTKNIVDKIEITVKDNGSGIPDSIKEKIFQPFFTTKPTGQGTGLGLSLSYDIVKAHQGELKVQSQENTGTEFYIILPI